MKHFYTTANLDKECVQKTQVFIRAYLEARGAECLLHHVPERIRGGAHIDGVQAPGDTECIVIIGGDGTLIRAARDLAGRNIPMLGVNRGHLGYLNQVSRQEDIAPVLKSLLNERYQLERRMMIHRTAWRREKIFLKDITFNEITITRKDPLKVPCYSVCVDDEYLSEYTADDALIAMSTDSTAYNLSTEGSVTVSGAGMMVLTPVCSHSPNTRGIVLALEGRTRTKVLNSDQVVSPDGDTSTKLETGNYIDVRCSELQIVIMRLKQIPFMQNFSSHLGGS